MGDSKGTSALGGTGRLPARSNRYGHFTEDGREFVITDPRPPRPWSNIVANPRLGFAVSQTGAGFSWIDNSQLAVLTGWVQDFAQDATGRFLYLRDADTGPIWSLSPAPVWAPQARYECRHGLGYTTFFCSCEGIESHWTLFVDPEATVELWRVSLKNTSGRARRLEVTAYLEWLVGVAPAPRREFHKLFIETRFDPQHRAVFARNNMWDVGNRRWGHWNTDFPYLAALATTEPVVAAEGDKGSFLGRNGNLAAPAGLATPAEIARFGRHYDPVAALRARVELPAGGERALGFALAVSRDPGETEALVRRFTGGKPGAGLAGIDASFAAARSAWRDLLSAQRVELPDLPLTWLTNDWLRYQAISARIWGRAGYYQQSGAYGFRDQLQDSQVWLTIDPAHTRVQIRLHARHQFADGSVHHWWHPLSELGLVTKMTDDLLWLPFVIGSYLRETGDLSILDDAEPFLDDATPATLREHALRAFRRVFSRTSPRGIPYIGAGDWNDGLSAAGLEERGESFWLGHFLAGLLADWSEILRRAGESSLAEEFSSRRAALVAAINEHGWDGDWYRRATLDDGSLLGSASSERGRIYLNAQTWAVLHDVATPERAVLAMQAVKEHLVDEAGSLLLAPAYDAPDERIGYITRYAPGLRENGGVYTHAATWTIAAACKLKDAELVGRLLDAINPAIKDPERYWAEPYVLPGNVDGPDSPLHGRAGWTWYTGSASWLHRVVTEWVLGVRPDWEGLRVDPCLPPGWDRAAMTRPWRGATYRFRFERCPGALLALQLDGTPLSSPLLPPPSRDGEVHEVVVRVPGGEKR